MTVLDILKDCCAETPSRFNMNAPFRRGTSIYATSGHIMARVAAGSQPELAEIPPHPTLNAEAIFARVRTDGVGGAEFPLPDLSGRDDASPCGNCKGLGTCTCSCGDEHECRPCGGNGRGQHYTINVGTTPFAVVYIRRLASFGVTHLRVNELLPAYWKCEAGGVVVDGLLSPSREAYEQRRRPEP